MPYVNERFSEHEFQQLKDGKNGRTWRQTLLEEIADMDIGSDTA